MISINKTLEIFRGGIVAPGSTWQQYRAENRGWQDTAALITLPGIVLSTLIALLLANLFGLGGVFFYGPGHVLKSILGSCAMMAAAAYIFSTLSGVFGGKQDFSASLAALSLAGIPGWIGGMLAPLPFIGWILLLAGAIATLVFIYKTVFLFLEIPDNKRIRHYVLSLLGTFVISVVLSAILGLGTATP